MYKLFKNIPYYEDEKIQMISLPYISSEINYEMVIILPRDNKYSSSYDYLINENVNFTKLILNLQNVKEVELYLPKFEFEYENNLNSILIEMGMEKPFSKQEANFNKINEKAILYIGDVLHKSFIKVDEKGTEAAVTTSIINIYTSPGPGKEIERYYMYVNHSFIFLITSNSIKDFDYNNLILFLGTVNNLNSSKSDNNYNDDENNNENNDNNNENIDHNNENNNDNNNENNNDNNNENNDINDNENNDNNNDNNDINDNENNDNNNDNDINDNDNNDNNNEKNNDNNNENNDINDNDNNDINDNGNNNSINKNESKDKTENQNQQNLQDITINQFENEGNGVYMIKVYSLFFLIIML